MRLSVFVHTSAPAWSRAVAEVVRHAADEVVVAVDSRVDEEELGQLEGVVDRLLRYEYADPPERVIAWLAAQCTGDWLLRLDHDEVPSRALLDRLPQLTADETLTHYWLERRWPFPTLETYLDEPPWSPNHELRLMRNDARFVRYPGLLHVPVEAEGPGAWIDESIYHFDMLVNDEETRRRKAERWERVRPGMRLLGRAVNEVVYLPEARPNRTLAPVPDADIAIIRSVVDAAPQPLSRPATAPRIALRAEIDALWPARPLGESAYRAAIELASPVEPLLAGERRRLEARVRNDGTETWPWGEAAEPQIRLSYHWHDGPSPVFNGVRTPFPHDLPPGESALVPLTVEAPAEAGDYTFEVELVHEHHRWFGDGPRVSVHVGRPRRIALLAHGDAADRQLALTFEHPEHEIVLVRRPESWAELPGCVSEARRLSAERLAVEGTPARRLDRVFATAVRLSRRAG